MHRILTVALALMLPLLTCGAAEQDWRQVTDFAAQGIFALDDTVIAWTGAQYSVSTDAGVSWSSPVSLAPVPGQQPEPIRLAVVGANGPLILTSTGKIVNVTGGATVLVPAPVAAMLVVDGGHRVYAEGIDGQVTVLGTPAPPATGRIYRAVQDGVLVQSGRRGLSLETPTGPQTVKVVAEQLPPAFDLPPLTTPGTNRWATATAMSWSFAGGKVQSTGERRARVRAYCTGVSGYHELLEWQGVQITTVQGGSLAGHWRTKNLPQDATLLTATRENFVVAGPGGIWYVPAERR